MGKARVVFCGRVVVDNDKIFIVKKNMNSFEFIYLFAYILFKTCGWVLRRWNTASFRPDKNSTRVMSYLLSKSNYLALSFGTSQTSAEFRDIPTQGSSLLIPWANKFYIALQSLLEKTKTYEKTSISCSRIWKKL